MAPLFRFIRLDREESRIFLTALVVMASVRIALLFGCTLPRITRSLEAMNRRFPRPAGAQPPALRLVAKRIAQASRFSPVPTTCLSEALAGKALLARYGHTGRLRIGVLKTATKFEAHAWLECANDILIGNPVPEGKRYVCMPGVERLI